MMDITPQAAIAAVAQRGPSAAASDPSSTLPAVIITWCILNKAMVRPCNSTGAWDWMTVCTSAFDRG